MVADSATVAPATTALRVPPAPNTVKVTVVGEASFLHQVIRHVEDARALKPGLLHLVDRVLRVYTPTVLLNCHARERARASVVPGELLGGYAATMHLIESGHRRIGFINGEQWIEAAAERLKGYRQALSSADIPYGSRLTE